jgi:hypothetical protein
MALTGDITIEALVVMNAVYAYMNYEELELKVQELDLRLYGEIHDSFYICYASLWANTGARN